MTSDQLIQFAAVFLCTTLFLVLMNWLLFKRNPELNDEKKLTRKLLLTGLYVACGIFLLVSLPVKDGTRSQLTTLVGIFLSALVAFSSTTLLSNFMAGLMLRITRPFQTGDFVRVGEHFGRVAQRGLLDTEIQTEYRELVSLPNSYLIANPITAVHDSGTIVSANVSLGYDIHHMKIQSMLLTAATEAGLEEPFVQIVELGNDAVSYRVSGLLKEVKSMLTTRSNLFKKILEVFHGNGVEVVSPTFMNQRQLRPEKAIVPEPLMTPVDPELDEPKAEQIAFHKAEQAEQLEKSQEELRQQIDELESRVADLQGEAREELERLIARKRMRLEILEDKGAE